MVLVEDYMKIIGQNKKLEELMLNKNNANSFYLEILDFKKGLQKAEKLKKTYGSLSNDLKKKLNNNTGAMITHLVSSSQEDLNKCKSIIQNIYDFISPADMTVSEHKHNIFKELLETNTYKNNEVVKSVLFDSVSVGAQVFEYQAHYSAKDSEKSDLGQIVNLPLLLVEHNFKAFSKQIDLIDDAFKEYVQRDKSLEYFNN